MRERLDIDTYENTTLGYAPISAVERRIEPCPQYDHFFPKPDNINDLIDKNVTVEKTVNQMNYIIKKDYKQVKNAISLVKAHTIRETCKNIFDFVYSHIKYNVEKGEILRSPAMTYYQGQILARNDQQKGIINASHSADCDCMTIFICSFLKCMNIPYLIRIASYFDENGKDKGFSHVYAIAIDADNKKTIVIDPVYWFFDEEKPFASSKTYTNENKQTKMADLHYLHGFDGGTPQSVAPLQKVKNYLAQSKNAAIANASNLQMVVDVEQFVNMVNYAIDNPSTWQSYENALLTFSQLSDIETEMSQTGLSGYDLKGFFAKLKEFIYSLYKGKATTQETVAKINQSNPALKGTEDSGVKVALNTIGNFISEHSTAIAVTAGILTLAGGIALSPTARKQASKLVNSIVKTSKSA